MGKLTIVTLIVLLAGCEDEGSSNQHPLQAELNANRAVWESQGLESYHYTFRRICFCVPEEDISVIVADREVQRAFFIPSHVRVNEERESFISTVNGYFDLIQEAIDESAAVIEVTYDPDLGYPTEIYIDRDRSVADEEIRYEVVSLRENTGDDPLQMLLAENRNVWNQSKLETYQFTLQVLCFCPVNDDIGVTVVGGEVESAIYIPNGMEIEDSLRSLVRPVEGYFDLIQSVIDQADSEISATFHSTYGYPTHIAIDFLPEAIDDEVTYNLLSLQ